MARPEGVSALALLFVIGGMLALIVFADLAGVGVGILALIGCCLIAYGLWYGKDLAQIITMLIAIAVILVGLVFWPVGIISIVIGATAIYYLTKPHVKDFFEKGVVTPPPPPPSSTHPSLNEFSNIPCPNCGHNNPSNFNYCGRCGTPLTEEEETKIY